MTMTIAMDDVLTAGEVSRMTGIPVSTLHDWAAKRERGVESPGPRHCRLSSRHRRWMRADVAEWLAASRYLLLERCNRLGKRAIRQAKVRQGITSALRASSQVVVLCSTD